MLYQKNPWYRGHFSSQYGVRSLRGAFARCWRTKTNASRVKTRRIKRAGTRWRDRGLDEVKRLQIGAFCLHHAFSPRATRRHDASSGYRTHVQRQSKCDQRPRPRASADVASSRRATRDRRDVHASGSTRFSLIEPRFLPCDRNSPSTCFPIEWIDPPVCLSQDSTATTPARTKRVPDVWANSFVPSLYQSFLLFAHTGNMPSGTAATLVRTKKSAGTGFAHS